MAGASACRRDMPIGSCNGGHRRSVPILSRHSDGVDRISALHDDLLVKILAGLGCPRAAARTSVVSKRWSRLWPRLPELVFRDIDPDLVDAALRQVLAGHVDAGSPTLSLLEFRYPADHWRFSVARIWSWLRAAARLRPANLVVHIEAKKGEYIGGVVMLPRLDRAESITLEMSSVRWTLPSAYDFQKLESLSLDPCAHCFDLGGLLSRCPALRRLSLSYIQLHSIAINLPLLEELSILVRDYGWFERVDIVAPRLKKLNFDATLCVAGDDLRLWDSVPRVEELTCRGTSCMPDACFGSIWTECHVTRKIGAPWAATTEPQCPPSYTLILRILLWGFVAVRSHYVPTYFPIANLSILDLKINASPSHAYGALVLHLLGVYSSVRWLKVYLLNDAAADPYICRRYDANCPCLHLYSWLNQSISLTVLEEVELEGFGGMDHEVDLLEVIFRISTNLEAVTAKLSCDIASSTYGQCSSRICSILEAHPNVKLNIYDSSGRQVLLA